MESLKKVILTNTIKKLLKLRNMAIILLDSFMELCLFGQTL